MIQIRRAWLSVLLLSLCSSSGLAKQRAGLLEKLQRIEQMVQEELQKNGAPGAAVAIEQDGKVVFAKGFGFADVENKVSFTAQTVSRIGSNSKTFTALALMQLV